MGYCFYQNLNDDDPEGEVTIVNANSSALKDNQMQYGAIDCEVLGLKFAVDSNAYYFYEAKCINQNGSENQENNKNQQQGELGHLRTSFHNI